VQARGRPRALVVDETLLLALGIETTLERLGYDVVETVRAGRDAPQLCGALEVELVVLGTPQDGRPEDIVPRLRALEPVPPKIIVLLRAAEPDQLVDLMYHGADALAMRSSPPDALAHIVDTVRSGDRYVAPAFLPTLAGSLQSRDAPNGAPLTARQREVLEQLASGRRPQEIATELHISLPTVKTHLAHIYARLGATSRAEALSRAVQLGLLG
jgi:DNA-binding NarL/FixJ family response regulator